VRAPCRDRQCPDAPLENFISGPGTKSVPAGFLLLQTQFGLNDLRAAELGAHDRQFSRGALAGYAPPTENGGLILGASACELNPQRHLNV
jgi:hypothetical protein